MRLKGGRRRLRRPRGGHHGGRSGGGLVVVTLDLGIFGTLGHQQRWGLAMVKDLLERQELGAVYLPEVSRLSRDQDFIEPFVLLRLM